VARRRPWKKPEKEAKKETKRDPRTKRPDLDRADEDLLRGNSERIKKTLRRQTRKKLKQILEQIPRDLASAQIGLRLLDREKSPGKKEDYKRDIRYLIALQKAVTEVLAEREK